MIKFNSDETKGKERSMKNTQQSRSCWWTVYWECACTWPSNRSIDITRWTWPRHTHRHRQTYLPRKLLSISVKELFYSRTFFLLLYVFRWCMLISLSFSIHLTSASVSSSLFYVPCAAWGLLCAFVFIIQTHVSLQQLNLFKPCDLFFSSTFFLFFLFFSLQLFACVHHSLAASQEAVGPKRIYRKVYKRQKC